MNKIETLGKWNTALRAKWPTSISNPEKFGKVMCRLPNRAETLNNLRVCDLLCMHRQCCRALHVSLCGEVPRVQGCRPKTWAPDLALPLPTRVQLTLLSVSLHEIKTLQALQDSTSSLTELLEGLTQKMDVKSLWRNVSSTMYPNINNYF